MFELPSIAVIDEVETTGTSIGRDALEVDVLALGMSILGSGERLGVVN